MIGQRIKRAIEKSGYSPDQVAAHADMSVANLYKIYKRDSVESRYLKKICEILNVPYSYFLDEDDSASIQTASGTGNIAGNSNKQQVQIGKDDCPQRLEALQEKYALLEKSVADKDMIIELLRGQKSA